MIPLPLVLAALAQDPPAAALRRASEAHETASRIGRTMGDSIWPGFRLDTIPVLYVFPDTGTLLLGWRGELPTGYKPAGQLPGTGWLAATERGAASTGTTLAGRPTAQVVASGASVARLVGLTAHEAFHVFEAAAHVRGRRFGAGENSFLVSSYPIFDAANEALMALEGRILSTALSTRSSQTRRDLARQFVATRERRHRALADEYATFERLGELNEGLAEYAQVRMLALARHEPWTAEASRIVAATIAALDSVTRNRTQSIRLRFYVLGPGQALLLDALEGPAWKSRLVRDDLTLQDALATAAGWRDAEQTALRQAEASFGAGALRAAADSGVASLRALRRSQVDSILAAPGVQLFIALDSLPGRAGLCSIDPQNLLQVDQGILLHTRTVRVCAGGALDATFTTPAVDERSRGSIRAVIGPLDSLRVTGGGRPLAVSEQSQSVTDLKIEGSRILLTSRRAVVELSGRVLTLRPIP